MDRDTTTRDKHRKAIARGRPPCALCGQPINYSLPHLHPKAFTVDHIVPLARGGTDTLGNKQASHRDCNRAKGDKLDGGPVLRRSGSLARPGGTAPPPPAGPPFLA